MNRDMVNRELERFGVTEEIYTALLVDRLRKKPFDEAIRGDSITAKFIKSYIIAESYIDPVKGLIHEEPEEHKEILVIEEQGEFLEKIKELVFGKIYMRFRR